VLSLISILRTVFTTAGLLHFVEQHNWHTIIQQHSEHPTLNAACTPHTTQQSAYCRSTIANQQKHFKAVLLLHCIGSTKWKTIKFDKCKNKNKGQIGYTKTKYIAMSNT